MVSSRLLKALLLGACALSSSFIYAQSDSAASIEHGRAVYESTCAACHSVNENRTGPKHFGIVGRPVGSITDFNYSPALKSSHLVWTRDLLVQWLTDPEKLIPGQAMGFRLSNQQDRLDVVAYLATLK